MDLCGVINANEIFEKDSEIILKQPRRVVKRKKFGVYTQKKQILQPNQQAVLECKLYDKLESLIDLCGVINSNEIFEKDSEIILKQPRRVVKRKKIGVYTQKMQILQPNQQAVLECKLYDKLESLTDLCGVIIPNEIFEKDSEIILTSSLGKVAKNNILYIYVLNLTDHPIIINKGEEIAKFSFLTSDKAEKLLEVDPQLINVAKMSENYFTEINQLIQVTDTPKRKAQPAKPAPEYGNLWFPTPETCLDPTNLSPLQREMFEQLLKQHEMEKLDPKGNHQDKITFLSKFLWEKLALSNEQKAVVGELLVEFSDIFAKDRFDVGYNTDLKIKLTPENAYQFVNKDLQRLSI